MENFFARVEKYPDNYPLVDLSKLANWSDAYNISYQLEVENPDKTFLYSAQHKDCVILAIILTVLSKKDKIVWRPSDVKDLAIDRDNERESDPYRVNMAASLSLLDWNPNESANSFLMYSSSFSSINVCENLWRGILNNLIEKGWALGSKILNIIRKYNFENRYLCVFEFSDSQLDRYVRFSGPFGAFVDSEESIKKIQSDYLTEGFDVYSQNLQARVLCTTKNSIDPYTSYILEPNGSNIFEELKREIEGIGLTKGKRSKRKSRRKKKAKTIFK